jgi:hypothetical protein
MDDNSLSIAGPANGLKIRDSLRLLGAAVITLSLSARVDGEPSARIERHVARDPKD